VYNVRSLLILHIERIEGSDSCIKIARAGTLAIQSVVMKYVRAQSVLWTEEASAREMCALLRRKLLGLKSGLKNVCAYAR
jgi:TRAP-type C4-dicarboxylate transport system permease small subunit